MFPDNSNRCFGKCPQHETEPYTLSLSLPGEIVERLLHRLSKLFSELSRIEAKEFLVKGMNRPLSIYHVENFR